MLKKILWIIPILLVSVLAVGIVTTGNSTNTINATLLQTEETSGYNSFGSIMEDATFYVKATLIEEIPYLENTSWQYTFELVEDYVGNMRLENNSNIFYVYSFLSGQYKSGETYYLFLDAQESYMADTILYMAIEQSLVVQLNEGIFSDSIQITSESSAVDADVLSTSVPSSVIGFERAVYEYAESHTVELEERTADIFSSDAYVSLESTIDAADAVWLITIQSLEELNPNASVCEYRLDRVLRGNTDTATSGDVFNGIFPTSKVAVGTQYCLLLRDVGNDQYEPFTFDYWIYPRESEESDYILATVDNEVE